MTRPIVVAATLAAASLLTLAGCSESAATEPAGSVASKSAKQATNASTESTTETAILAGGCFWCVEADFEKLDGVVDVVSGYSGGTSENPTYGDYGAAGHVEVVEITYDPSVVTYAGLVEWLLKHIDPTDGTGSFNDRGAEYGPVIYYADEAQKTTAESILEQVEKSGVFEKPLAVKVERRQTFWPAEDYHQDYHSKNGLRYSYYRYASGRDEFVKSHWGERATQLEFASSPDAPSESAGVE